jgi:hypothetical protein
VVGAAGDRGDRDQARRWRRCAARKSARGRVEAGIARIVRGGALRQWLDGAGRGSTRRDAAGAGADGRRAQFLVERAPSRHRRWWASPSAHLLLLTPFALAGLMASSGSARWRSMPLSTLAAAVEATRENA